MDVNSLVRALVNTDFPDQWTKCAASFSKEEWEHASALANPLWLERMSREGKLFLHPEVTSALKAAGWQANKKQWQMVWASVIASLDGEDSKARYQAIKKKIIKKHGNIWWRDVHNRVKPAFAARMRIKKNVGDIGPALQTLASHSSVFALGLHEELTRALERIPKE